MVAYKHTPHQNNQARKGYHPSFSATGVQYNSARVIRSLQYRHRNEEQSIDNLVQSNSRFLSAPETIGVQSDNPTYSQASHYRETHQKTSVHHETKGARSHGNEDYDLLRPVWFEKIMEKLEQNKRKEKKAQIKERSYISLS